MRAQQTLLNLVQKLLSFLLPNPPHQIKPHTSLTHSQAIWVCVSNLKPYNLLRFSSTLLCSLSDLFLSQIPIIIHLFLAHFPISNQLVNITPINLQTTLATNCLYSKIKIKITPFALIHSFIKPPFHRLACFQSLLLFFFPPTTSFTNHNTSLLLLLFIIA